MSQTIIMRLFILSLFILFPTSHLLADEVTPSLDTQKEKESYSIGYQIGLSMKSDGVEVDIDKFNQGLKNALDGKEPLMNENEMKKLIVDIKKRSRENEMRKIQDIVAKNAEESENFLQENGEKEGITTTESGLQYRILKKGDGISPGRGDLVTVHYRGTFIDGTEFDSSYSKGTPQTVQTDGVIKGWIEALQMMKIGSKWEIFVPPHLAYGRGGLGGKIPPNKVLVFEIELLSIEKTKKTEDGEE